MAITTYSELLSAVSSWSDRTTGTTYYTSIPDFIMLTEQMLEQGAPDLGIEPLRVREMEETATLTPNASGEVALPSDYLAMRRVEIAQTPVRTLDHVTPTWARDQYPFKPSGLGKFYTIEGGVLTVWPTSTSDVTLEYYGHIPALTASNASNWLLAKMPNTYLFGCLYQGAIFAKADQDAARYSQLFVSAARALRASDAGERWSNATMRTVGATP